VHTCNVSAVKSPQESRASADCFTFIHVRSPESNRVIVTARHEQLSTRREAPDAPFMGPERCLCIPLLLLLTNLRGILRPCCHSIARRLCNTACNAATDGTGENVVASWSAASSKGENASFVCRCVCIARRGLQPQGDARMPRWTCRLHSLQLTIRLVEHVDPEKELATTTGCMQMARGGREQCAYGRAPVCEAAYSDALDKIGQSDFATSVSRGQQHPRARTRALWYNHRKCKDGGLMRSLRECSLRDKATT
jgi:hypothetical protein